MTFEDRLRSDISLAVRAAPGEVSDLGEIVAKGRRRRNKKRIVGIDLHRYRVVSGTKIMPVTHIKIPRSHVDELWQIFVKRTESVIDPRTDRGKPAVEHVPPRMKLNLCAVVIVGGPNRSDEADVVDARADVWKPVTYFDAALAVFLETDLQRIELVALLSIRIVHNNNANFFQSFRILHIIPFRFVDRFARKLVQHRLVVETLHMTHAATHEQPDDTFGFGCKMRFSIGRLPSASAKAISLQHRS